MLQPRPWLLRVSLVADFCLKLLWRCSGFLQGFLRRRVDVGWEEGQDQPVCGGEGWLRSQPRSQKLVDPARQGPAHISLNKGQISFLMKHSPHFSDWRLLHSFNIWYLSIAINFSWFFSPFDNEAEMENQQYHYSLLKNISICKRLTKPQDSQWPFLPLNQGMYFKHKHLLLRWATVNASDNMRQTTTHTALGTNQDVPSSPHPRDYRYCYTHIINIHDITNTCIVTYINTYIDILLLLPLLLPGTQRCYNPSLVSASLHHGDQTESHLLAC